MASVIVKPKVASHKPCGRLAAALSGEMDKELNTSPKSFADAISE